MEAAATEADGDWAGAVQLAASAATAVGLAAGAYLGTLRWLASREEEATRRRTVTHPAIPPELASSGRGILGVRRNTPTSQLAALAYPLLDRTNTIDEDSDASFEDADHQARPTWSRREYARRGRREGELLSADGRALDMRLITEPAPPFAIREASPDFLGFCGFTAAEVRGRTMALLQDDGGPSSERRRAEASMLRRLMIFVMHKGVSDSYTFVHFTKHNVAFRNHVLVEPLLDGRRGLLRGFSVTTMGAEILSRSKSLDHEQMASLLLEDDSELSAPPPRQMPKAKSLDNLPHSATPPYTPPSRRDSTGRVDFYGATPPSPRLLSPVEPARLPAASAGLPAPLHAPQPVSPAVSPMASPLPAAAHELDHELDRPVDRGPEPPTEQPAPTRLQSLGAAASTAACAAAASIAAGAAVAAPYTQRLSAAASGLVAGVMPSRRPGAWRGEASEETQRMVDPEEAGREEAGGLGPLQGRGAAQDVQPEGQPISLPLRLPPGAVSSPGDFAHAAPQVGIHAAGAPRDSEQATRLWLPDAMRPDAPLLSPRSPVLHATCATTHATRPSARRTPPPDGPRGVLRDAPPGLGIELSGGDEPRASRTEHGPNPASHPASHSEHGQGLGTPVTTAVPAQTQEALKEAPAPPLPARAPSPYGAIPSAIPGGLIDDLFGDLGADSPGGAAGEACWDSGYGSGRNSRNSGSGRSTPVPPSHSPSLPPAAKPAGAAFHPTALRPDAQRQQQPASLPPPLPHAVPGARADAAAGGDDDSDEASSPGLEKHVLYSPQGAALAGAIGWNTPELPAKHPAKHPVVG